MNGLDNLYNFVAHYSSSIGNGWHVDYMVTYKLTVSVGM